MSPMKENISNIAVALAAIDVASSYVNWPSATAMCARLSTGHGASKSRVAAPVVESVLQKVAKALYCQ